MGLSLVYHQRDMWSNAEIKREWRHKIEKNPNFQTGIKMVGGPNGLFRFGFGTFLIGQGIVCWMNLK